ncbi:hypothetical protein L6R53_25505 [Myxococcota bacterium]|nr:hypothetical protein [Myxococcota bacterium]
MIPWSRDHLWRPAGWHREVHSVALTARGTRLALGPGGEVHRATPGGAWRVVLAAPGAAQVETSQDEDVLIESEATVEELIDLPEAEGGSVDEAGEEDEAAEIADQQDDLLDELSGAVQGGAAELDAAVLDVGERVEGERPAPVVGRLWASASADGPLLVGRADGLWRSQDDGQTWVRVSPAPGVRAVLEREDGSLLAGGAEGLGVSLDQGQRWRRAPGALDDVQVHALARVGEALLAGTAQGLYISVDGRRWSRTGTVDGEPLVVWDILPDPDWAGGMWLATSRGLLRSDDLGQTLRPASRNPLVGVRDIVALPRPGHLLITGEDGAWETVDGGLTWQPVSTGLPGPRTFGLATLGELVLLGGHDGVYQLGRAPAPEAQARAQAAAPPPVGPPLFEVVGRALERPGLDLDVLTVSGRLVAATMMPRLQLGLEHRVSRYRDTLYDSLSTSEYRLPETTAEVLLCWGACASVDATTDYDSDGYDVTTETIEIEDVTEDLAVVDGQVYDMSDIGALSSASANIAQRATTYRTDVARLVSDAWISRNRLVTETTSVGSLPLREQVSHALLIDELSARLDLYTDGWFSRALASDSTPR